MKYAIFLCLLALVVCVMSTPAVHARFTWNLEACEKVAAKARAESTVCADYICTDEFSYGLSVKGVNCTNDGD